MSLRSALRKGAVAVVVVGLLAAAGGASANPQRGATRFQGGAARLLNLLKTWVNGGGDTLGWLLRVLSGGDFNKAGIGLDPDGSALPEEQGNAGPDLDPFG